MTQYDNEFFRGPPEGSPTLATDQRPTGVEFFQAKPEKTTASADVPVTREEASKDPPKKKSKARRITKAIKLLASCMAAVVITEAAVNIAATIEPPPEVPTGLYYAGQWPGADPVQEGIYRMDLDADMGNQIQIPMGGNTWKLNAPSDWRMCWFEGDGHTAYIDLKNQQTGVYLVADLSLSPHQTDHEEDSYTTLITPTGQTLYVRAFFLDLGIYGEEYGLDRDQIAASAEIRQMLVDEIFAGITVTPGTENGWQGIQIGDRIYSQQGPQWYGLGGFGDLEIHIPWVHYTADHNLQNMTPYSRVTVNGITWSVYFAENDTYLWAVPNIDPEICLGGLTARFMCADAVRRGEYINDEEWLEMGGFTSVSQRQTAVDILVECLQHHYALRESRYPRDWPWKGPTDDASYWVWAESLKGTWTQFSFGDEAYRVNSTDPELRFCWEVTRPLRDDMMADLEISRMVKNEEVYAIGLSVCRMPFTYVNENCTYRTVQATGGETLYLEFRSQYHADGADFTTEEMDPIADQILRSITFQSDPDDSGWCPLLLCDTMHSPGNMEWSGWGIVGSNVEIRYIHTVEGEGLNQERPIGTRTHNGITWTLYYDLGDNEWESSIWAVPDIEPDVCIGFEALTAMNYYREQNTDSPDYVWDEEYELTAEDVNHAVETVSEALSYIYPLGVEPETEEGWYIPDWPMIGQNSFGGGYNLMEYSRYGTFVQFSLGERSYRLESGNPNLCFFWNRTAPEGRQMQADLFISHMTNDRRDWRVDVQVQEEPFGEYREEDMTFDTTIPVDGGGTLYLRFVCRWAQSAHSTARYEDFSRWVTTVMDAIAASPADPNGWGQVWICDLMTTPLSENWDGNEMVVDENYRFRYFNRVEERGLQNLEPYITWECNNILWSFYYVEEEDILWAVPSIEDRWCIGAYARDMATRGVGGDGDKLDGLDEKDYLLAALEGMAEGLSKYYPRQGFVMEPEEDPVWPGLVAVADGADWGVSSWSNQNTEGLFSLGGYVFEIGSYREDLRFWWQLGSEDMAAVEIYSIPEDGSQQWSVLAWIQQTPFATYDGDTACYRTVRLPGNETLYFRFDPSYLDGYDLDALADEILRYTSFDYCGKEENWHTVCIGDTLQTKQGYDWTGLGMVYEDYEFRYVHDAQAYDVHQQDYEGQRTINGVLWTFRFHKDNDVLYAYPESEPDLCIGASPDMLYSWYESRYGSQTDYFETIVESMSVGLQNYYLRPGVEIHREEKTDPVFYTAEMNGFVQFSLGYRGYYLQSDLENAWMTWYFTQDHGGVLAADLSMGADCGAQVYISEVPMAAYSNRSHGQIPVENGGTLYWYCIEMYDGSDAQLAALMNSLTATGASDYQWGGAVIDDTIYSRQSLEWSGWETVETDGGRSVMMWNLERPANLELGELIAQKKINRINWTLYITEDYSSEHWPFIWAVPDMDPNLAIGSDYENAVYRYYEVNGLADSFNGNLWSAESKNGAAEMIFQVLSNYYPR